jgi:hypothetical protein
MKHIQEFNKYLVKLQKHKNQSHYREVPQWEIFIEQELSLGQLALLKKKIGPIMSNFLGQFFSCFHGQKIRKNRKMKKL